MCSIVAENLFVSSLEKTEQIVLLVNADVQHTVGSQTGETPGKCGSTKYEVLN